MTLGRMQHTIARRTAVSGFGFWSGRDVQIEFRPAAVGAGISFVRADLGSEARVPAHIDYRIDQPRRTNLRRGGVAVDMVEHVLAALAGLGVDNCEVWSSEREMPGCDGSSAAFVDALTAAGLEPQSAPPRTLDVTELIRVADGDSWIEARPAADGELHIEYRLDYPTVAALSRQTASTTISPQSFPNELAACRTFLLETEARQLVGQGLGTRVTTSDLLVYGEHGPIDNVLRFPNECARHKALDVLGDLALAGRRVVARVVAHRSGHRLHAELTKQLVERFASAPLRATA